MYARAWEVVGYYRLEKTSLPEVTSEPKSEERGSNSAGIWGESSRKRTKYTIPEAGSCSMLGVFLEL